MTKMAYKIVFVILTLFLAGDLAAQAINEDAARAELVKRGYDPDRFKEEMLKKGIDLTTFDPSNPVEVDRYRKAGEEVMKLLDEEKKKEADKKRMQAGEFRSETEDAEEESKAKDEKEPETKNTEKEKKKESADVLNVEKDEDSDKKEKAKTDVKEVARELNKLTYGQHIFYDKSIKIYRKVDEVRPTKAYVLGSGDKVSVSIWGPTQENFALEVQKDGYIQPTGLPRMYLAGLTLEEAENLVFSRLRSKYYFQKENFAVRVTTARNINVNVVGEVVTNGTFNISAVNTAFNAIMAAGGPTDIGSIRKIQVLSAGKKPVTLDVYKYLQDPSASQSFYLSENDYIHIPVAERLVTVSGEINRPYRYELTGDEQLNELIRYAGGLKSGALRQNIQIRRLEKDTVRIIDVDYSEIEKTGTNFRLFNGDQIIIRKIRDVALNEVSVSGAVEHPGIYAINENSRLFDILTKAKVLQNAVLDFAYVFRSGQDKAKTQEYININLKDVLQNPASESNIILLPKDRIFIYFKDSYVDESFVKVDGAVRNPGEFLYNPSLTLKDALLLAGGLRREASRDRVDIFRLEFTGNNNTRVITTSLKLNDSLDAIGFEGDFELKPFDQIFVRTVPEFELQRNVMVTGEVKYPGMYALMGDNTSLSSLIRASGGLTNEAFISGATLLRKKDNIGYIIINLEKALEDNYSYENIILQDNDEINIPKLNNIVSIEGATKAYELYPEKILGQNKIQVAYRKGKNAKYYIEEFAGGLAKDAASSKISVVDASGKVTRVKNFYLFKQYPSVGPGSQIKVGYKDKKEKDKDGNEKNEVKWGDILANSIAQATAILSLILLIQNVN